MWSGMGSTDVLKECLETGIISRKRVQSVIHFRLRERRVDVQIRVYGSGAGETSYAKEGLEGDVTANVMRNGVGDFDVLKATGKDLVVVRRVTPGPNTVEGRVGKDRRVVEVRGI